jgi:hypothetical protein
MKQFINTSLNAPNVLRVRVDPSITQELRSFAGLESENEEFAVVRPPWSSDVRWISPRTINTFRFFLSIFDRLNVSGKVAPYLDLKERVMMYSGFIVSRSFCEMPDFHVDWIDTNNEAFTLLTPISTDIKGFGLVYKRLDGSIGEYEYRSDEAIIFGDKFYHSTKPAGMRAPTFLLSFTFGTDKMEHWEKISRTAKSQGELIRFPDGRFFVKGF